MVGGEPRESLLRALVRLKSSPATSPSRRIGSVGPAMRTSARRAARRYLTRSFIDWPSWIVQMIV